MRTLLLLAALALTACAAAPPPAPPPQAVAQPAGEPASTGLDGGPVQVRPAPF